MLPKIKTHPLTRGVISRAALLDQRERLRTQGKSLMRGRFAMRVAAAFAAALLICLVACLPSAGRSLDGTCWKLVSWSVSSIDPADVEINATFADSQLSGNSGVNTYHGVFTLGPSGGFAAGPLVSTRMARPEPAMRAETAYLTLLGQAASYKLAAGRLALFDKGGNESLVFEAASND